MSNHVTLTVTITADAEAVLVELAPRPKTPPPPGEFTPYETPAELAAVWVGRWCRGYCRRTAINRLSWPPCTLQMPIRLREATHAHLVELARERDRDPLDMAAAIINGTAADLLAAKRRGFVPS